VACDGPSGQGPWMGRVIRSQHISNLKYEGYNDAGVDSRYNYPIAANFESCLFAVFIYGLAVLCQVCFQIFSIFQNSACSNLLLISRINKKAIFFICFN
ncbi:hypothetical protein FGT65_11220, partial [Salmonella enterica subsp. enterica serovar Cerro]|nr:hypothetical protein [Salmonella enterica]EBB5172350.1 hypothetical protein [Salmonella enterica subsp. enterica serovar Cerro]EDQ6640295.1 hypothetical protein [Salmonella enterica subsp. enterica serovar Cerro]